jgi:CheY-like chemotaxis protein
MQELQTATPEASVIPSRTAAIAVPLVLVADADAASRVRRARQLEARGFRVALSRTAFETIVKASYQLPDLILLDLSLGAPDVDETVELLSTCPATAHIPIVRLRGGRRLPTKLTDRHKRIV